MKYTLLSLMLFATHFGFAQATHSVTVNIDQPEPCLLVGMIDQAAPNINVFPNPATQQLIITSERSLERIEIMDAAGRIVFSQKQHTDRSHVDVSRFARGMYHCIIRHSFGVERIKLILQ